ncbi:MAG: hypothetical protein KGS72_18075 [Cyanobacteria bacterium REEB67]|nr:hypothetical protein [Cyanobacteria bacterium REEB67]
MDSQEFWGEPEQIDEKSNATFLTFSGKLYAAIQKTLPKENSSVVRTMTQ